MSPNVAGLNGPVGFADATGIPRIDRLGGLMTGYGNRPYDGSTFFVRALVRFQRRAAVATPTRGFVESCQI